MDFEKKNFEKEEERLYDPYLTELRLQLEFWPKTCCPDPVWLAAAGCPDQRQGSGWR